MASTPDDRNQRLRIAPVSTSRLGEALAIINAAAEAYRGKIPDDCWREPYMSEDQFAAEIASGVQFLGVESGRRLLAVMGFQRVLNVHLIRHAYVVPECQGMGLGGRLMDEIFRIVKGPILVGTWRAAEWAVRFYQGKGFALVSPGVTPAVLKAYWTISNRQIATSVVLSRPSLRDDEAVALIRGDRDPASRAGAPRR